MIFSQQTTCLVASGILKVDIFVGIKCYEGKPNIQIHSIEKVPFHEYNRNNR